MRYLTTDAVNVVERFATGSVVTIELYEIATSSVVTLTSNACSEIGVTGLFKWSMTGMATQPSVYTEYAYTMTDALSNKVDGKLVIAVTNSSAAEKDKLLGLPQATEISSTTWADQAGIQSALDTVIATR